MTLLILEGCKLLKKAIQTYIALISIECEYKIKNLNVHKWDYN